MRQRTGGTLPQDTGFFNLLLGHEVSPAGRPHGEEDDDRTRDLLSFGDEAG